MARQVRKRVVYVDDADRRTDDLTRAVTGEVVEYDAHDRLLRRTRFFLDRRELPWLPVGEAAFLLWVFAALVLVWVFVAIILRIT